MEETHHWGNILRGAVPASIAVVIAFVNITSQWKWAILFLSMGAAYFLVAMKTKKKADLFTAMAIVFLSALAAHFLQGAGFL